MYKIRRICDVHSHIAPGVDDGAVDVEMALEMIRTAHSHGITDIICTSHSDSDMDTYRNAVAQLKESLGKDFPVKIYPGCEVYCSVRYMSDILADLDAGTLPTLNDTCYVLCEFSPYVSAVDINSCFDTLLAENYFPVLAHSERYYNLHGNISHIRALCDKGCLIQINAYSLVDEKNDNIKSYAREILREKLATFIGSDAHRTNHRNYTVSNGLAYINETCDEVYAGAVCYSNARELLSVRENNSTYA